MSSSQENTEYSRCMNSIFQQKSIGNLDTTCSALLTNQEIQNLRNDGYKVFPIFFPWGKETISKEKWDPITGNRAGYSVRWS